jgi:hypothetical protein
MSDFGITILSKLAEDSFEKYYNKELDLDEGMKPCFINNRGGAKCPV